MQEIFELEIWSKPGSCIGDSEGLKIEFLLKKQIPSESEFVIGHNFSSGGVDVDNLALSLKEGELKEADFKVFCAQRKLPLNLGDCNSAARFLEFNYGRLLAWINLPYNQSGKEVYLKIAKWILNTPYNLQGSHIPYCVNPLNPGEKPLFW